ncbi:MAG: hypothetical protein KF851_16295 [Pirellulaceae bacterium]|nr:hypothetical protein [Pirellulaceae bacterium]
MTKFSTLIEEVADESNHTLSAVLLKSKLLAARMRSRKFRNWVDAELNRYPDVDSLPEYRIIYPRLLADFWGRFGARTKNVPLSLTDFPQNVKDFVERHCFLENIGEIEAMLDTDSQTFHRHFGIEIVQLIRSGPCVRVSGQEMQSIQAIFTKSSVRGVLHAIRTRLLDFLIELRETYPELENDPDAINNVSVSEVSRLVDRVIYSNCTIFEKQSGDLHMGDKYETGQAGAVGPHAIAHGNTFNQLWIQNAGDIDLHKLAADLESLVGAMKERASEPEHQIAIGNVEAARQCAENGDGAKALEYLKAAGKWTLNVARDIGVGVAAAAISLTFGA